MVHKISLKMSFYGSVPKNYPSKQVKIYTHIDNPRLMYWLEIADLLETTPPPQQKNTYMQEVSS